MGVKRPLSLVLLVDDSDADNTFHTLVIEEYGLAEWIHVELTGERALAYLETRGTSAETPAPALILLDINLPGIDGWQFLARYRALDAAHQAEAVVVMLTTSTDPRDRACAELLDLHFFSKPLTHEIIDQVVKRVFPQLWNDE